MLSSLMKKVDFYFALYLKRWKVGGNCVTILLQGLSTTTNSFSFKQSKYIIDEKDSKYFIMSGSVLS